jgi:membrane protein DedA with SNARE-associated domain
MVATGFLGILVGDSLIYLAGRRVGRRVRTGHGWLARVVTPARRILVEGLFAGTARRSSSPPASCPGSAR